MNGRKASLLADESEVGFGRWTLSSSRLLIVAAMAVTGYLLWLSADGLALAGCGPGSGCDQVLHSRWAYWLGMPVSALALLSHLGFLAGTILANTRTPGFCRNAGRAAIVATGVAIMGAAVWFIGVQLFAIKSICPFCMSAHLLGSVAVVILAGGRASWRLRRTKPAANGKSTLRIATLLPTLVGTLGVAGLIAGQLFSAPKTYLIKTVARTAGEVGERVPGGKLSLYGGRFQLEIGALPVIGSSEAPFLAINFFTYTCPHCRALHGRLKEIQRRVGNQLGILCLPVPLERRCNPLVEMTRREHVDSCELARLALALARLDQRHWAQFDDWLFTGEKPPPLAEARNYAFQLAGREKLEPALAQTAITEQIRTAVAAYAENSARLGASDLPQLILGSTILAGEVNDPDDLLRLFRRRLGVGIPGK